MAGPRRSWNQAPLDPNLAPTTNDWMNYVQSICNRVEGSLFPPATPMVTTVPHPGAVQIAWNEVANANSYAVYETSNSSVPAGLPLTTVPANRGGTSNSFLRASLNDTVTRYYWVQAIDQNGDRSQVSAAAPGAALSTAAPVIPVSQAPLNQGGVGGGAGGGGAIYGRNTNQNRLS